MKIPQFWARASREGYEAPGWSFTSLAEAQAVAEERVGLLLEVLRGERERDEGRYLYGDRPVKEPVIEALGSAAQPDAVVTRNAYGALCLNTNDVVFVDVDAEDDRDAARKLDQIKRVQVSSGRWAFRVYRTKAGYRVAATHARMAPDAADIEELFDAVGADPMYRTLCAMQESFRARLTPKPWRIGLRRMPGSFPWRDASVERAVADWVREYDRASGQYSVCELVGDFGAKAGDPLIDRVLAFHDQRVLGGKPLA